MNKKGFTVVELIVTFVIVMTISLGLFSTVDSYRERQQKESYRKELNSYRNEILKTIQDDVVNNLGIKKIEKVDVNSGECTGYNQGINIVFEKEEEDSIISKSKKLCIGYSDDKTTVLYGNIKFVAPSKFIKYKDDIISNETDKANSYICSGGKYILKKIYSINIELYHEELTEKFNINVVYPKAVETTSDEC